MKEKIKLILLEMYVSTASIKPVDKYVNQITDLYTPVISDIKDRIKYIENIHADLKKKHADLNPAYFAQLIEIEYLQFLLKKLKNEPL